MADISLIRIDYRLIHGQVITKWMKQTNADRIEVIDDKLSQDPFMSKIYIMAAPPRVKVEVLTIKEAIDSWNKDKMGSGKLLVLFQNVSSAFSAWEKGFPIFKLQVGGLGSAPGRKVVYNQITLNNEDAATLTEMEKGGVKVFFQTVPEDKPAELQKMVKKLNFK